MDSPAPTVRPDWFVDVATAQQRLAGHTLDGDCASFLRGVERFQSDLPAPNSELERRVLHDCVIATLTKAGHSCHVAFHVRHPECSCGGSPLADIATVWRGADSHAAIGRWIQEYLRAFRARHAWPAPWSVAHYLDQHFRESLDVTVLARRAACGCTTLTRQFKRTFGLTMGRYQTRLRLREALVGLRARDSKVDDVARTVGYRSPKNFYKTLKDQTGLTPSDVRELTDAQMHRLLNDTLPPPQREALMRGSAV